MSDEDLHAAMLRAHRLLTGGTDQVHKVAAVIYARCRHSDERAKFAKVQSKLEAARDLADKARLAATEARTELISVTGCDGTCKDRVSKSEFAKAE